MNACGAGAEQAIACFECVCLNWSSLIGLVLPTVLALVYLPRLARELTLDDLLIGLFAGVLTYANRVVSGDGIAHVPWMTYITVLWAIQACTTDRVASLRSLPMIWFLVFITVLIPDLLSAFQLRPDGRTAIPGGGGLLDGLVIKPLLAVAVNLVAYYLKVNPILPNRLRRGKKYDDSSRAFLMNISPWYRRPSEMDSRLVLIAKAA